MKLKFVLLLAILGSFTQAALATDYYINATGSDTNTGTSPAEAWRTPARVYTTRLQPGDRVLLAGGQVFEGGLTLGPTSYGTPSQPIVVTSYGKGRATIASGNACGFYAYNMAGIEVRNLAFVGAGRQLTSSSGVSFYLDAAATQLSYLRLDSLEVSGYRDSGIAIGSWNGQSGYADVRITNCRLHDNGEAGLSSYAYTASLGHRNWYVGNCTAYDNAGRPDVTTTNTGSGIVLGGVNGALIEKCTAYHNGWLNANPGGGPVGIWGWCCNNLIIQLCESHHNLSGTSKDGGGFDLDGGCTNSVMQYNYSHDNQGAGFLLAQYEGAPPMHDLTVRYNISENDARHYDNGALMVWSSGANGGIVRANFYNNTVFLGPTTDGSVPKGVSVSGTSISNVALRNNLLYTSSGQPVVSALLASGLRLEGNCYWTLGGKVLYEWLGTVYNGLDAWRLATNQELLTSSTGRRLTGLVADPRLPVGNLAGHPALPSSSPAAYNPELGSGLLGAALKLSDEFGIDPGSRDFFGNALSAVPGAGNIGASEAKPVTTLANKAAAPAAGWCQVYPTVVTNQVTIAAEFAGSQKIEIHLWDMLGHACQHWSYPGSQLRNGVLTLPVQGLAPGQYLLQVQADDKRHRQLLVLSSE